VLGAPGRELRHLALDDARVDAQSEGREELGEQLVGAWQRALLSVVGRSPPARRWFGARRAASGLKEMRSGSCSEIKALDAFPTAARVEEFIDLGQLVGLPDGGS
jgi:hypothetical protein